MRRLAATVLLAAALSGCGNDRSRPADVERPEAPAGFRGFSLADAGVTFDVPTNWQEIAASPPLMGGIRSRTATVAVWRYPRSEPLPEGEAALEQARDRLVERVKLRNPTFDVRSSRLAERGGAEGIELVGTQTIAGLAYKTRSSHLFRAGAELVIDAYARPDDFDLVDRAVFRPLLRSLKVTRP